MKTPPLDSAELALLRSVFMRHPKIIEARLFGSRAKGTHGTYSDIDLALFGDLSPLAAQSIAAELDELPLPYRYDVQVVDCVRDQALREHIERVGICLYRLDSPPAADSFDARFQDVLAGRVDFWTASGDLSRRDLAALIILGLSRTSGSYQHLAEQFHIQPTDYRRWMDFLRRKNCAVDPAPFRQSGTVAR